MAIGCAGFFTWVRDFYPGIVLATFIGGYKMMPLETTLESVDWVINEPYYRHWVWTVCYSGLCIAVGCATRQNEQRE